MRAPLIRPILDPETVPVESTGAGLPLVSARRLSAQGLRERFALPLPWEPEPREPGVPLSDARPAAVLVPLVLHDAGLSVLLTRRATSLTYHAGQISFPGGRIEPDDASAAAAALRETYEEVGLEPASVEVLGALPEYPTSTGFRVTPVIGLVHEPFTVVTDALEVAEVFEVPFAFLMDPAHHEVRVYRFDGGERRFFSMPWGGYFIWGVTAGILRNFYRYLSAR